MKEKSYSFKNHIWQQFKKNKIALGALYFLMIISLLGIYAPFFASSKPLIVKYAGQFYFPLFRYLFFPGYYTKPIDLFFNVLMFILPLGLVGFFVLRRFFNVKNIKVFILILLCVQGLLSFLFMKGFVKDPERNFGYEGRKENRALPDFEKEWGLLTKYQKLNHLVKFHQQKEQREKLLPFSEKKGSLSLLYDINQLREKEERQKLLETINKLEVKYHKIVEEFPAYLQAYLPYSHELIIQNGALKEGRGDKETLKKNYEKAFEDEQAARKIIDEAETTIYDYRYAKAKLLYMDKKNDWLRSEKLFVINPFLRTFHWEDDAGGSQQSNQKLPWWERTRLNRKDLTAGLIYGVRVSLIVGFCAVGISLLIGIPLGLFAGYYAGKVDMITLRFIEIWEAMPTFFTLLLISAIFHSKSLFLTILVLGLFSWTSFARFIRAECLRERSLAYVMASKSLGFRNGRIMFSHVLPNALSPILAILPFSMMAAITSEAALSFLGLGEENSTSWGILMSEARTVFPGESYLLWPPALLLTAFLVAIALVGDGMRDALDPKMQS